MKVKWCCASTTANCRGRYRRQNKNTRVLPTTAVSFLPCADCASPSRRKASIEQDPCGKHMFPCFLPALGEALDASAMFFHSCPRACKKNGSTLSTLIRFIVGFILKRPPLFSVAKQYMGNDAGTDSRQHKVAVHKQPLMIPRRLVQVVSPPVIN